MELRDFQEEAVKSICDFYNSDSNLAKLIFPTGFGLSNVIIHVLKKILLENNKAKILILTSMINESLQIEERIQKSIENHKNGNIKVLPYNQADQQALANDKFNIILYWHLPFQKHNISQKYLTCGIKHLAILNNKKEDTFWANEASVIYNYTYNDAINDGYYYDWTERSFINNFIVPLLKYNNYTILSTDERLVPAEAIRLDIITEKNGTVTLFEIKKYMNLQNTRSVIDTAISQAITYKDKTDKYLAEEKRIDLVIILPCKIEKDLQEEIYRKHEIIIWNINNIIYLCDNNQFLLDLLNNNIPFSITGIRPEAPLKFIASDYKTRDVSDTPADLIEKLDNCDSGNNDSNDKKYENICSNIIKMLFNSEFYKVSEQHKTKDEMFRMDLLCSLKETTGFWQFLMNFYKTKFVVFEFKNYSDNISQNLIYITEKYLFSAALRNVAFIVSRKGFNENAQKAVMGCLKENGKLIIGLNDYDLKNMLAMKQNGEEPSDYLLDKVEDMLMSVSK